MAKCLLICGAIALARTTITVKPIETAMSSLKTHYPTLYETDYLQWIEAAVAKLQSQDYANVDWENLIEEIADMGRSERKSLKSNLIVILVHLLKWQFQPEKRSGSWEGSIIEHRRHVRKKLSMILLVLNLIWRASLQSVIHKLLSKQKLKLVYQLSPFL